MRRRVLYVNTPTYTGGAEVSLLTLMRHLDPERYTPVLVTSGQGQLAEAAGDDGVRTFVQDFPWFRKRYPWRYPLSILKLARIIRGEEIALVHSNCDLGLPYIDAACRLTGRPFVAHVRDFDRSWYAADKVVILNRAAQVIANSHAIAAACAQAGVRAERLRVIYNPIEVPRFAVVDADARRALRRRLNVTDDAWIVGIVGQVRAPKGHEEFLQAAQQLCAQRSDVVFIVVGASYSNEDRAFQKGLQSQVATLGLAPAFRFVGQQQDVAPWMWAMDILAVPSWREPFGRVVVEGLAAGCAVVATAVGGIPEIIAHEQTGLLIPPQDSGRLAQAILRLMDDAELRATLVAQGRLRARDFGIEQHLSQMQTLYDEVLAQEKGHRS